MANVGGILGTAGGFKGTGVDAPTSGNFVTQDQVSQNYGLAQNALQQQQAFANAVQPGGLAALQSQQQLLGQLQTGAQGGGPNPAMNQLNQATVANTANQAALMAGQRGSAQNTGMIARQAAMQGGANQQQAAGQAATLSAQQQIAYMQQLQQQQQAMASQQAAATGAYTNATQAEQMGLLNAATGMQQNLNAANAGMIGQTAQQQASFGGGSMSGVGSMMSAASKAEGGMIHRYAEGTPNAPVATDAPAQSATDPKKPKSVIGKLFSGMESSGSQSPFSTLGTGIGDLIAAHRKQRNSQNQQTDFSPSSQADIESGGLMTGAAQREENLQSGLPLYPNVMTPDEQLRSQGPEQQLPADNNDSSNNMAEGGQVPAMVSPGEQYIPPKEVKEVLKGKNPLSVGERIPGKPKYPGNNYANDVVPKTLEEGGIVIPNKIMQSKNPHWEALKFVRATMAKNKKGLK